MEKWKCTVCNHIVEGSVPAGTKRILIDADINPYTLQ